MIENRDTFFARLAKPPFCHILTPRSLVRIELMYILAKYGHRGQFRKSSTESGQPPPRVFEHPRGAALIIIDELELADEIAIIIALGHDTDEDSEQMQWPMTQEALGENIGFRLRLISKRGKAKDEYLPLLWAYGDWRDLMAKGADRLDNLRHLGDDQAFCRKQIKETREKYLSLFRRMVEITPAGLCQAAQKLYDMIETIVVEYETRFAAEDAAKQ